MRRRVAVGGIRGFGGDWKGVSLMVGFGLCGRSWDGYDPPVLQHLVCGPYVMRRFITPFIFGFIHSLTATLANANDTYFMATGQENSKPLIFRSITAVPAGIREADLPIRMTISWQYQPSADGMPDSDVNQAQNEFEDALVPLDVNDIGRQVLVVAGNNQKIWYWYVKNADEWKAQVDEIIARGRSYPIKIVQTYEPDWSLYRNFLSEVKS
jgi:hypothetical protein